jgi:hypothetical protein
MAGLSGRANRHDVTVTEESEQDGTGSSMDVYVQVNAGKEVHAVQGGDMNMAAALRPASPVLEQISELTVADSDIVAVRGDQTAVRLGQGAYVRRTVEERLLRRLAKPSVTALVGEAGYGKSSVLWHLHHRLSGIGRAPLLLPASALLGDSPALSVETIASEIRRRSEGRTVLLVDTLDLLLHDAESRRQVSRLLRLARQERLPTLVTSRPVETRFVNLTEDEDLEGSSGPDQIFKVTLNDYDDREREAAINVYSSLFYDPEQAGEVAQVLRGASLRGLPLQEVCRNPLAMRLLFELYGPERVPPDDIDSIGLHDQYWQRRVVTDDRGPQVEVRAADLSADAEGIGLALLTTGAIESSKPELVERALPLTGRTGAEVESAVDTLRARGVLRSPPKTSRLRFFHQTFFEHVAARSLIAVGEDATRVLLERVRSEPHDLFYGEVAAQFLLLADRRTVFPELVTGVLGEWLLAGERALRVLAIRTYARIPAPSPALREVAARALENCATDVAMEYLTMLPAVHHPSFDRAEAELSTLRRHTTALHEVQETAGDGGTIALGILGALARLAGAHPDSVSEFFAVQERFAWLESLSMERLRSNGSPYLRLFDALYPRAPRVWGPVLTRFFKRFAAGNEVDGAAEILELLARHSSTPLDEQSAQVVIDAVHSFASKQSALRMELAYVAFRIPWYVGLSARELAAATRTVMDSGQWSVSGRRAELRTLTEAAFGLPEGQAEEYLDAVLAERGYLQEEAAATVIGEILVADGDLPCPLVRYARERSRNELGLLPARRDADGRRPVPMLFVNALYGARAGGAALLGALPEGIPDVWWSDMNALMPLLVPAALARHPVAVRHLDALLAEPRPDARGFKAALGRLRTAAEQGSVDALAQIIRRAEVTGEVAVLAAMLELPTMTEEQLHAHPVRLRELRGRLAAMGGRAELIESYTLWRVLIDRGIEAPPEPDALGRAVAAAAGYPQLIGLLRLIRTCMRSGAWAQEDVSGLVEALGPHTVRRPGSSAETSDAGAQQATVQAEAQQLVVGLRARYSRLPASAVQRRAFASDLLRQVKEAAYDRSNKQGRNALIGCVTEFGQLLSRMDDPLTLIEIILDGARWLHDVQPSATRWRRNVASAWHPAIHTAVTGASAEECRRFITALLASDREMARLAVAACVDHIRPIPPWLQELGAAMPNAVHRRMLGAMSRNARDGSPRSLPELYTAVVPLTP